MPLELGCEATEPSDVSTDLLALGVFAGVTAAAFPPQLHAIDQALCGALADLMQRREFVGKKDQKLTFETLGRLPAKHLLLIGLGNEDALTTASLRNFAARAGRAANTAHARSMCVGIPCKLEPEFAQALAEGIVLGTYRFTKYLTGDRKPKSTVEHATVLTRGKPNQVKGSIKKAVQQGSHVGDSVCLVRNLVNEPPNELTPAKIAAHAESIAATHGLYCEVFDRQALEEMGMNLLLAVGRGSANDPYLIHLTYMPTSNSEETRGEATGNTTKKLVVVGKGLTFDSGGLCNKPAAGMGEMKCDMAGAANVLGLMNAIGQIAPDIEVHGIIATAENMPDGNAFRPGDIVRSYDGRSVEIINTDAEGRLVLADALAYAKKLEPTLLVSNATLTGACVVALGQRCAAYYASAEGIAAQFEQAAREAGEQFWRLPFLADMRDLLKSDVADLKHTGDRWGGSVTAAVFLKEFVGGTPFVHCDIAGPAFSDKPYGIYPKGGTGHGVLTLLRLVEGMGRK